MRALLYFLLSIVATTIGVAQTINDSRLTRETVVGSGLSRPIMIVWLDPSNPNDFFVVEKTVQGSNPVVDGYAA
jgi:hypothetical protein